MKGERIEDDDTEKRVRILKEYLRQTEKTAVLAIAVNSTHDVSYAILGDGLVCNHMLEYLNGILDVAKVMMQPYVDDGPDAAADQMPNAHQSTKGPH